MRVCFYTGSRSEYGLIKLLAKSMLKNNFFNLSILTSGLFSSKKKGTSFNEISKDGLPLKKNISLNLNIDTSEQINKNFSILINKANIFFKRKRFDILIVTGDRYEALAISICAYIKRIPVVHIHGGEKTYDSLDDNYRHAISKFSSVHFVSHASFKNRLIQLGEDRKRIHVVGGLGASAIKDFKFLDKKSLSKILNIEFKKKIIIVNYYPEAQDYKNSLKKLKRILSTLNYYQAKNTIIFTLPSHDYGNKLFIKEIKNFIKNKKNMFLFYNLGQQKYLSLLKNTDLFIGNSSSGILEMPSFGGYTINIGKRQFGRILSNTVYNLPNKINNLKNLIDKLIKKKKNQIKNPYYKKNTIKNILKILKKTNLEKIKSLKNFKDLNF